MNVRVVHDSAVCVGHSKQGHASTAASKRESCDNELVDDDACGPLGLATYHARNRLKRLEARDRYLRAKRPQEKAPRPSIEAARTELRELEVKLRERQKFSGLRVGGSSLSSVWMKLCSTARVAVGHTARLLVLALLISMLVAGWKFVSWFVVEYWAALLILAGLSIWALRPKGRPV